MAYLFLFAPTNIKHAGQVQVLVEPQSGDDGEIVVDEQRVLPGGWSSDGDGVPLVVVERGPAAVADAHGAVAQVENVVDVAVHQLDGDEVLLLARVEQQQTVRLLRLELEVDVGGRVGLQHRQPDERVLRPVRHRVVHDLLALAELRSHLFNTFRHFLLIFCTAIDQNISK
jgi:hypothetical protein